MRYLVFLISCLIVSAALSGQSAGRAGKDYALFFAVNDYDSMTDLKNPIRNAKDIAKELEDKYGFRTEVVENPTLDDIEDKLAEYAQKFSSGAYTQGGQLLIYFSGHGMTYGSNGYFMPTDADEERPHRTGLEYDVLRTELNGIACKHLLVVIDACYSISFDPKWPARPDRVFGPPGSKEKDQVLLDHENYRTRRYFTSDAEENQTPDKSTLAYQFLAGLRKNQSYTGYLTADELFSSYLRKAAPTPGSGKFGDNEPAARFLFFQKQSGPLISPQEQSTWNFAVQQHTIPNYQFYLNSYPEGYYRKEARAAIAKLSKMPVSPTSRTTKVPDFMVFISGGTFRMGDTVEDDMGQENETPVHSVALSDFYLARNEVSVADFARFVDATRYVTDAERDGGSNKWTGKWEKVPGSSWRDNTDLKARPEAEYDHPVIHVSWNDAIRYCNWLSREHGLEQVYQIVGATVTANWAAKGYRLPTEAEWEYAARSGGKNYLYAWGNAGENGNVADESGNWKEGSKIFEGYNDGFPKTAPVGSFPQGRLGLSDMTGNVWEWCWDWYAKDYYGKSPANNPRGADSGTYRVIRGGSWNNNPSYCRAANRLSYEPTHRYFNVGFRLARSY